MQQLLLEYIWVRPPACLRYPVEPNANTQMFVSAFFSLVLYLLVWLKLRGNLVVSGGRWTLRRATARSRWDPLTGQGSLEAQVTGITRQMML